jgi:hypothetical protein
MIEDEKNPIVSYLAEFKSPLHPEVHFVYPVFEDWEPWDTGEEAGFNGWKIQHHDPREDVHRLMQPFIQLRRLDIPDYKKVLETILSGSPVRTKIFYFLPTGKNPNSVLYGYTAFVAGYRPEVGVRLEDCHNLFFYGSECAFEVDVLGGEFDDESFSYKMTIEKIIASFNIDEASPVKSKPGKEPYPRETVISFPPKKS